MSKLFTSATRLQSFSECPLRYFYQSTTGEAKSIHMEKGSHNHRLFEKFLKQEPMDPEDFRYVTGLLEKVQNNILLFPDYTVEQPFAIEYPDIVINGVRDYVGRRGDLCSIIDWKFGRRVYSTPEAESSIQASIYALKAFSEDEGIKRVCFQFVFLMPGIVRSVTYHRSEVPELERMIRYHLNRFIDAEQSKKYLPVINSYCGSCPCLRECAHNVTFKTQERISIPADDEEFMRLYSALHVTSKYLEELERVLKEYAGDRDRIGDVAVHRSVVEKFTVSTSKKARAWIEERCPGYIEKKYSGVYKHMTPEELAEAVEAGVIRDGSYERVTLKLVKEE